MTEFIPAAELKKKYHVKGRFYILTEKNLKIKCRSLLTIEDTTASGKKKLLVVMLNPGSSRPLTKTYKEALVSTSRINELEKIPLIDSKPDITQYQIMRVMHKLIFSNANIINLYDVREPKSRILFDNAKKEKIQDEASIFSDTRKAELKKYFTSDTTVILAWGNIKSIFETEKKAIKKIEHLADKIYSVRSSDNIICHPSPQNHNFKIRWLDSMIGQLIKAGS